MTQPNERVSVRLEDGRRRQGRVVRLESVRVKQGGDLKHILADDERELLRTARARPLMSAVEEFGGEFSMLDANELSMSVRYAESLLKLQTLRKHYEKDMPRYESELLKLDSAVESTFYHFPKELTPGLAADEYTAVSNGVLPSIHTTRAFHKEEHHGADHPGVAEYYPSPHSKPPPLPPQLVSHEIDHNHHGAPPVPRPQSLPASQHYVGGARETIRHHESHEEHYHQYFSSPPPMPESVKKSLRRKTTRKSSSKQQAPPPPPLPPPPPQQQQRQPPAPPAHVPAQQFSSTFDPSTVPHRHGEPQPPARLQQSLAPMTPSTWHAPVLERSNEPVHERALFPTTVSFIKYNVLPTRSRQPPKSSLFMPGSKAKYVDLRPSMPPVYEPIHWLSCSAAMALCAGYEHAVASPFDQFKASPLFLYLNERYVDQPRPSGFTMESAALSMQQLGACSEDVFASWAAGVGIVRDADLSLPGPEAYQSAAAHPVELHRVKCERKDIIRCLQSGFVIVTAVQVFYSFHECPSDGFVALPERGERPFDQENEGGQGIVIVGFDEECDDGVWIVRNSRGRSWGLEGHAYLPFGYETYFGDLFVVSYPA